MIYFLNDDPRSAVAALLPYDVNSAFGESLILLATVKYKRDHKHPVSVWLSESSGNYEWMLEYLQELRSKLLELGHDQLVKAYDSKLTDIENVPETLPELGLQQFPMQTKTIKVHNDVIAYYESKYKHSSVFNNIPLLKLLS